MSAIHDSEHSRVKSITGKAVVNAVRLESKVKGPHIIFSGDVYNMLDKNTLYYFRPIPEKKMMRMLCMRFCGQHWHSSLRMAIDSNFVKYMTYQYFVKNLTII